VPIFVVASFFLSLLREKYKKTSEKIKKLIPTSAIWKI
jgi:hypothetical protein